MTKREISRFVAALADQGVTHRRIKGGGYLLFLPNGGTATMHMTTSDWRGLKNLRSVLERAGLTWPA